MDIDNILLDLEIIKQVKENDKLAIIILPGCTKLFVDNYSMLSKMTRKYNGYDRESCTKYLDELVENIEKSSKTIINGNHKNLADILQKSIKCAVVGLNNLKDTYESDSITIAKLVLIINKLNVVILSFDAILLDITLDDIRRAEETDHDDN